VKSISFEPVNQQSLSRQIADQLRQAILDGSFEADDRLPTEDELAQRFQVSRPTIREALKILAAQNLVRSKRGPTGGTFVNRPSIEDLTLSLSGATTLLVGLEAFSMEEIIQTRLELETLCCRLAAIHATADDLASLRHELSIQKDEALSPEAFCASDVKFHRAIANATGNRMLSFVMYTVIEAVQPISNMLYYKQREKQVILNQHQRLIEAIEAQDQETACETIKEQVNYLAGLYQTTKEERAKRTI
jgi:DNA-binding FadR family transcriptional regulator